MAYLQTCRRSIFRNKKHAYIHKYSLNTVVAHFSSIVFSRWWQISKYSFFKSDSLSRTEKISGKKWQQQVRALASADNRTLNFVGRKSYSGAPDEVVTNMYLELTADCRFSFLSSWMLHLFIIHRWHVSDVEISNSPTLSSWTLDLP